MKRFYNPCSGGSAVRFQPCSPPFFTADGARFILRSVEGLDLALMTWRFLEVRWLRPLDVLEKSLFTSRWWLPQVGVSLNHPTWGLSHLLWNHGFHPVKESVEDGGSGFSVAVFFFWSDEMTAVNGTDPMIWGIWILETWYETIDETWCSYDFLVEHVSIWIHMMLKTQHHLL